MNLNSMASSLSLTVTVVGVHVCSVLEQRVHLVLVWALKVQVYP